jgi:hypothetical protein
MSASERNAGGWCGRGACQAAGVAGGVLALLLLAGCSQQKQHQKQKQEAPRIQQWERTQQATSSQEYTPLATTVSVTLKSGRIDMPAVIGSGWTNFVIENGDDMAHSLLIQGNGVDRVLPNRIQPGKTQTMRVDLKPGTYQVICPECSADFGRLARQLTVVQW